MSEYGTLSREQLSSIMDDVSKKYDDIKAKGLKLDLARGKPEALQLDLSSGLDTVLKSPNDCYDKYGNDCRNYGFLDGLPEAKELFGSLVGVEDDELIIGGNASLNLMYDTIAKGMTHGFPESEKPWGKCDGLKFLCPSPGYDRHFAITESFGFELIMIPMDENGPDMAMVKKYAESDPSVKGIWCVPKYSNPAGITYSDEVVRAFADLNPAAADFKIMWDNAYFLHGFRERDDELLDLFPLLKEKGKENMAVMFFSTSKVTYPGAGISWMASGKGMISYIKKLLSIQTIGYDKINQLRHVRFFGDADGVRTHMKKQAELVAPKFDAVLDILEGALAGKGIGTWNTPNGGYFISFDTLPGCAKRTVQLAKEAGVIFTGAGATFPYGKDPNDRNVRLAPTYPSMEEVKMAAEVFTVCAEYAALEKLLG